MREKAFKFLSNKKYVGIAVVAIILIVVICFILFKGGKDYENAKLDAKKGTWEGRPLDYAQLVFISSFGKGKKVEERNGETYYDYPNKKSFKIEIFPKLNPNYDSGELGIFDKHFEKNRTIENLNIDGNSVKVIKTGKKFDSQNIGPNERYVYFEIKDKSVLIEFTNVPIDYYLIESFFRMN